MQTVKQACRPRPGAFDPTRRDTVLDLTDLIDDRIDPAEFFAENYITARPRAARAKPGYRAAVMGGFYTPAAALGPVGHAPLKTLLTAPGQTAWVNLLEGEPLVIMLDELPPYFENAASKSIGDSNLSVVTTTALSNLLVALGRPELGNVCLVISDLRATYDTGAAQIHTALNHMEAETDRVAMNLEPVRMNTDEFYHILRKRIFETLPDNAEIEQVAQG